MTTESSDRSLPAMFGWAAFLACSWTWCIGMFLPVLLIRDYGFWGWLIFALPNVVGAAAMGTILAPSGASLRMIEPHRGAGIVFSIVTISFHAFFIGWVVRGLIGPIAVPITAAISVVFYFAGRKSRRDLSAAVIVFILSTIAFAWFVVSHGAPSTSPLRSVPRTDLLPLAAVCVLGFTFCPYLDLTFHRARQSTAPVAGITAFAVGFGVMFLLMICFTLWYAKTIVPGTWSAIDRTVAWVLASHMMLQAAYTVAVHFRELNGQWKRPDGQVQVGTLAGLVLGAMPIIVAAVMQKPASFADPKEFTYRLFMSFYALVFPAYVWLCMTPVPQTRTHSPSFCPTPFLIAVALAAPFYWLGFISGKMQWLLVGVVIIAAVRFARSYLPVPARAG